jgi:Tfp pilus assembly protein PilN
MCPVVDQAVTSKIIPRRKKKHTVDEGVHETKIRQRRHFPIGRHLSFAIDESSIQMAAVSHLGRWKKIRHISKVYIPGELTGASTRNDFIAHAIDDFINEVGGYGSHISVAISGKETALRTFLAPALKKKELASAIRYEARKQVPFPPEDCIYDYRPAAKVEVDGRRKLKISLHAATRKLVEESLEPFRQQKIPVASVCHSLEAIGQLLRHLPNFNDDTLYTLINIDRTHSEIAFYRGTFLEFFHIGNTGSSSLGKQSGQSSFEIFAKTLAGDIQTALDYYSGQYPRGTPDKVYVYGDLSYSTELLELLNGYTGFDFERFPAEKLDFAPPETAPFADTLPVCLPVLAASASDVKLANLLPVPDRMRRLKRRVHTVSQFCLAVLLLVLAGGWAIMKAETSIAESRLVGLNRQIESFKSSTAYHTYNVLKRQIASDHAFIEKIKESPSYLSLNLKELSLLTPPSIRLFHLAYRADDPNKNLSIQGIVSSKDIPPEVLLAEYVATLSASQFFDDVRLTRHMKRKRGDVFEIEFHIDMRGVV